MGGKPSRTREHFYVCFALLMMIGGCAVVKDVPRAKMPPAPVLLPEPKPAPAPKVIVDPPEVRARREANEYLSLAQDLMSKGDYDGSLRVNQTVLSLTKDESPADAAIFKMWLIFAHPKNPKKDNRQAISFFSRVVKSHPESPWAEQAKIWVGVLDGVEKLKQVDLEIEERRRDRPR